jgi:pimeloyl-ACP methyl ester carboxylesterase
MARIVSAAVRARLLLAAASVALAALAGAAGCAVPVRAERESPEEVFATVRRSALSGEDLSVDARLVLERADLADLWNDDPDAAIARLHDMALAQDTRERLFGLSELSLARGQATDDRRGYLGAAVYATLYLFGAADAPPPGPFDARFRTACDLYERGLAGAFRDEATDEFRPSAGRFALPVGSIEIAEAPDRFVLGTETFDRFEPAGDYEVRGMRSRVRKDGLGVPLIAGRRSAADLLETGFTKAVMPPRLCIEATAILDFEGELADLAGGGARGTLRLLSRDDGATATVRGSDVPIASDVTAPLAYTLTRSEIWDFEIGGFLGGGDDVVQNGLLFLSPHVRGKIPLVLVHGTASSPARWAELINELLADPEIVRRYEGWLFIYKTGAPILVSAATLRDSLARTCAELDPDGTDPALRQMVVVGHSQGGLLTRLVATSSGDRFWRHVSDEPFESLDLTPKEREEIGSALFFEPLPQVRRVVFCATPHRGSYVAGNIFGKIGAALVSLPKKVVTTTRSAVARNLAKLRGDVLGSLPNAVDNMAPGSAFVQALDELPISPDVVVHSIVAVDGGGPVEEGADGVVAYESAHLPTADSEIVVNSPHSCQGHPRTILEIRRILREHAAAVAAAGGAAPAGAAGAAVPAGAAK